MQPDEIWVLAEACVATRLPSLLQQYVHDLEKAQEVADSVGFIPPSVPNLIPQEVQRARMELQTLEALLTPAHNDPLLEAEIFKLFAAFNLFTGDDVKLHAQVEVWADNLEDFPMYAIRRAARWAVRGDKKLPALSDFIRDVKLAIGNKVLTRKRVLEKVVANPGKSEAEIVRMMNQNGGKQ